MYLIFFPETGVARKFRSYDQAQEHYPGHDVLAGPIAVPLDAVEYWYEQLFDWAVDRDSLRVGTSQATSADGRHHPSPSNLDHPKTSREAFWRLAESVADTVSFKKKDGYMVNLARCDSLLANRELEVLPTQAWSIVEFFAEERRDYYTRDEMRRLCNTVAFLVKVKTRQDPWRIFRYYRPTLTHIGVLQ